MQLPSSITSTPFDRTESHNALKKAFLHLANGMVFPGRTLLGQEETPFHEVIFNTGMTGYDASLTDPSYAGQMLVFTYPLIGNYGVPPREHWESEKIHATGVIVSEACLRWSHGKSTSSLLQWLQEEKIPIIIGADTREITKTLREAGTMPGAIRTTKHLSEDLAQLSCKNPQPHEVSVAKKIIYGSHSKKIIAIDCGMKATILRRLRKHPVEIHRVPYNYNYLEEDFDGIFLSNGPGDPLTYSETISILKKALERKKPIFGICLGAQLLSLAAGASTYKLKYGHRGHNQPCINIDTGRCYMTSQNHGYAIEGNSLPNGWIANYRNLNDNTVEGIRHEYLPYSAVQFHPEANPGPTDTEWLFTQFIEKL